MANNFANKEGKDLSPAEVFEQWYLKKMSVQTPDNLNPSGSKPGKAAYVPGPEMSPEQAQMIAQGLKVNTSSGASQQNSRYPGGVSTADTMAMPMDAYKNTPTPETQIKQKDFAKDYIQPILEGAGKAASSVTPKNIGAVAGDVAGTAAEGTAYGLSESAKAVGKGAQEMGGSFLERFMKHFQPSTLQEADQADRLIAASKARGSAYDTASKTKPESMDGITHLIGTELGPKIDEQYKAQNAPPVISDAYGTPGTFPEAMNYANRSATSAMGMPSMTFGGNPDPAQRDKEFKGRMEATTGQKSEFKGPAYEPPSGAEKFLNFMTGGSFMTPRLYGDKAFRESQATAEGMLPAQSKLDYLKSQLPASQAELLTASTNRMNAILGYSQNQQAQVQDMIKEPLSNMQNGQIMLNLLKDYKANPGPASAAAIKNFMPKLFGAGKNAVTSDAGLMGGLEKFAKGLSGKGNITKGQIISLENATRRTMEASGKNIDVANSMVKERAPGGFGYNSSKKTQPAMSPEEAKARLIAIARALENKKG